MSIKRLQKEIFLQIKCTAYRYTVFNNILTTCISMLTDERFRFASFCLLILKKTLIVLKELHYVMIMSSHLPMRKPINYLTRF